MTNHNHSDSNTTTDLQLSASPGQEIFPSFVSQSATGDYFRTVKYHQNPRKKRTKLIRIDDPIGASSSSTIGVAAKPKYVKKPDPSAPKITRPCSECGKKFWSWKALFGHMRCHPERQWRGINPPPNFRRPGPLVKARNDAEAGMTEEDHQVAACLLMLANSPIAFETQGITATTGTDHGLLESDAGGGDFLNCRFECSSCKKVFGSHQALGGHRASHKNVKGCFAITRSDCEELDHNGGHTMDDRSGEGEVIIRDNGDEEEEEEKMMMVLGHRCSICLRVFSSGQALGGHKRCHWEKGEGLNPFATREGCDLDLNLPAPLEDDNSLSSYSSGSGLALDLRLGL